MGISREFIVSLIRGEAWVLLASAIFLLIHGAWIRWHRRRDRRLLNKAYGELAAMLDQTKAGEREAHPNRRQHSAFFRGLPPRILIKLIVETDRAISGTQEWLSRLKRETGLVQLAEAYCSSVFWWRRLEGARLLTVMDAGQSVMPDLLQDPHPTVRAQAVEWASLHPSQKLAEKLLRLLRDGAGLYRFAVLDGLTRMGTHAAGAMVEFLSGPSEESFVLVMRVASSVAGPGFLKPALTLSQDPSAPIRAGAAALLGALGGSESVNALLALLRDSAPEVRAAAARSLGKLAHWPATPLLAENLRDRSWEVRREAGLALRAVGSPGILMLRRLLADKDHFAADMAKQVLDMPTGDRELQEQWT